MSGVELVSRLLTAHGFTLPRDQVRHDPAAVALLLELGLVESRGSGTGFLCDACDFPHPVKIGFDPVSGKVGWRCPEAGFVEADSEQTEVIRLLPDRLAEALSQTLQCSGRRSQVLLESRLWRVGYFEFENNDVNVFMAGCIWDANAIVAALRAEPALRNGVVISPEISGFSGLSVEKCRFARIEDAIVIGDGGLECDRHRVAALAGIMRKKQKGRPAHPFADTAMALIKDRFDKATCADSKRAEVKEIKVIMGDKSPGGTKLAEIISDVWG